MATMPLSGSQLAILLVIVGYLGVPAAMGIASILDLPRQHVAYLSQVISISIEATAIAAVPAFRERTLEWLRVPVRGPQFGEVAIVATLLVLLQFALFGANALRLWIDGGDLAGLTFNPERMPGAAFSAVTLAGAVISCLVAPVIEELAFRGFLLEAWTRTRPAWIAMLLSSCVFALTHVTFAAPFAAGLLLCALYVRTGALRAAIFCHFVANVANWFLIPRVLIPASNGDLQGWWFHLLCLALLPLGVVVYVMFAARSPANRMPDAPGAST